MFSKSTALLRLLALPALAVALASCSDASQSLTPTAAQLKSSSPNATLLECPTDVTATARDTIDSFGDTISVVDAAGGKHQVVFPANAVSVPTEFVLTVPANKYVKVDVSAYNPVTREKLSITFPDNAKPTLAISYKRCTRNNTTNGPLHLYYLNPNGTLELVAGSNKEGNTSDPRVKGLVGHFSEYGIGTP